VLQRAPIGNFTLPSVDVWRTRQTLNESAGTFLFDNSMMRSILGNIVAISTSSNTIAWSTDIMKDPLLSSSNLVAACACGFAQPYPLRFYLQPTPAFAAPEHSVLVVAALSTYDSDMPVFVQAALL